MSAKKREIELDDDVTACTARLTACRQDVMARYTGFLEALQHVRLESTELTKDLEAMSGACAQLADTGGVIRNLWLQTQKVADSIGLTLDMVETKGSADRFRAAIEAIGKIQPRSRQLSAVASLTAITSANLGEENMSYHINLMRNLANSLQKNCDVMIACIQDTERATFGAAEQLRGSRLTVHMLQEKLAASVGQASESQRLGQIGEHAVRTSDDLLKTTRLRLRDLIGCMQFSDAFVQRIDHVVEMLEQDLVGAGSIAQAQLFAMISDQEENRAQAGAAIDGLQTVSQSANGILGSEDTSTQVAISECQNALSVATEASADIKKTATNILDHLSQIAPANARAQNECAVLHDTFQQMRLSANNVSFKARRYQQAGKAMTTLAYEVQNIATETGSSVEHVQTCINAFKAIGDSELLDELLSCVDGFEEIAGECTELFTAIQNLLTQKSVIDDRATKLRFNIDTAQELLDGLKVIDENLKAEQPIIAQFATQSDTPDDAENTKIFDLYTMDREREIHKTIFPLPENETGDLAESDIDDDGFETF